MKKSGYIALTFLMAVAAIGGWYLGRSTHTAKSGAPASGERRLLYYQSAMHPWIKSEQPGNCTICGMQLTPVYEGEKGFAQDSTTISLSSNQISVINVQTEPVALRSLERIIEVAGRIEPDETRLKVISAYVPGRIEELFVNFSGAEVQAGQPLAHLYSPMLLTAEQELATLMAKAPSTNSPRLMAEHSRLVAATRQRLKRYGLSDEQIMALDAKAATNLYSEIVAPLSGTVLSRAVVQGQYVEKGAKLFEIADLSTMWFRFDLYEQDLDAIQLGQAVQVRVPALPGKEFEGTVTFIEPTLNDLTRSAKVRVELENPTTGNEGRLLHNNLFAQGKILVKTEPVLAVSRRAVLQPGDQPRVYVATEGGFQQRIITLGRRGAHHWEVVEGLQPGDKVVTEGNLLIDSQAELNHGVSVSSDHQQPTEPGQEEKSTLFELTAEQQMAAQQFLAQFSASSAPLAADDLAGYTNTVAALQEALAILQKAFAGTPLESQVQKIPDPVLPDTVALSAARKGYLAFSNAAAAFARDLRRYTRINERIFKCPMYPKFGQDAYWVQEGPVTRNPFYGSEMLECGSEVK